MDASGKFTEHERSIRRSLQQLQLFEKQFFYNIADTTWAWRNSFIIIVSGLPGNRDLSESYD